MAESTGFVLALMEKIRADSAETKLSPAKSLATLVPAGIDPITILETDADDDIKMMSSKTERYYFSEQSITEQYARHLFRLAERDPVRLIAETTRDESKTYPRPTPIDTFADAPFSMSPAEIEAALIALASKGEYSDIQKTSASNGALYLYSITYLTEPHAAGLAEWAEVGQKENP